MADLECQAGSAVEYKVRRDSVQFGPQSQLRFRQDVQTGLKVCRHISVRPKPAFSVWPIRCPSPRVFRNFRPVVIVRNSIAQTNFHVSDPRVAARLEYAGDTSTMWGTV